MCCLWKAVPSMYIACRRTSSLICTQKFSWLVCQEHFKIRFCQMKVTCRSRLQTLLLLRYDLIAKPHQCFANVRIGSEHVDIKCVLMSAMEHKTSAACCTAKTFNAHLVSSFEGVDNCSHSASRHSELLKSQMFFMIVHC